MTDQTRSPEYSPTIGADVVRMDVPAMLDHQQASVRRSLRREHRVWVRVHFAPETAPALDLTALGGVGGIARVRQHGVIEVYESELRSILATEVRTDRHRAALEEARRNAAHVRDEWKRENARAINAIVGEEARTKWVHLNCNVHWTQLLGMAGFRTGVPQIDALHVMHPTTGDSVDATAWLALSDDERRGWLVDPPELPQTGADAASAIGEAIARALEAKTGRK